jgi:hypothetical protein
MIYTVFVLGFCLGLVLGIHVANWGSRSDDDK